MLFPKLGQDHLHIRGEYQASDYTDRATDRITSTYVENTVKKGAQKGMQGDHLHIRGEYSKQIPL